MPTNLLSNAGAITAPSSLDQARRHCCCTEKGELFKKLRYKDTEFRQNKVVFCDMKFLSLRWAIAALSLSISAQQPPAAGKGSITGRILDSVWPKSCGIRPRSPLCRRQIHGQSNGAASTNKGVFYRLMTSSGHYTLTIGSLAIRPAPRPPYMDAKTMNLTLGGHLSYQKNRSPPGVTVTASKGLVEIRSIRCLPMRKKDITSQGGVATDILKKVPMVSWTWMATSAARQFQYPLPHQRQGLQYPSAITWQTPLQSIPPTR